MKITCQYTGIEFEASSARSKNHPDVSGLLTDANRVPGAYGRVKQVLADMKAASIRDIDAILAAGRDAIDGRDAEVRQGIKAAQEEAKDAKDERRQRERQNAILCQHGYHWVKNIVGTEDQWAGSGSYYAGIGEEAGYRWVLVGPDGHASSVAQALEAIA